MSRRTYGQVCGVARTLDVLGERWTLLIVRELLLGPKRFGALEAALPGIGPNLLSARLAALAEAGIVERAELPAPASVSAYALTQRGEGLREVVEAMAVWGFDLIEPERQIAAGIWPAARCWHRASPLVRRATATGRAAAWRRTSTWTANASTSRSTRTGPVCATASTSRRTPS